MSVAADTETAVLIVGGGPVGLTARALLHQWGVRALLVEKHRELSPFPRSRLVNVRSMEIFRGLGLADRITARAFAPRYGRVRFRDTLTGADFASAAMVGVNAPVPESPALGVVTSQDRLEPVLLDAVNGVNEANEANEANAVNEASAVNVSGAPTRFGVELLDLAEEGDAVVARLADHRTGAESRIRARYVLAADGAHSTVRRLLGIGTVGPGALGAITTVVFDADLDRWCARRPAGVYFTAHGSFMPLYPEGGWAWFGPTPEGAAGTEGTEATDWGALVADALGPDAGVRPEVLRVQHWVMEAFVAERLRHGRILLAGDAAHAVPIIGGLGMNAGVADVHNLCWKLAGVLQGWAGPGLLDTYAPERHPVARETLRQAVANAQLLRGVQSRRREQLRAGEAAPDRVELPWTDRYFAQLGLVLGVTYRSAAVLTADDDPSAPAEPSDCPSPSDASDACDPSVPPAPPAPGTDYVPTPAPGHRLPHLPLGDGRSTLDAVGPWFTLFTADPGAWAQDTAGSVPLRVEPLAGAHTVPYRLGPHGALLVRPDGHVAAHWPDGPPRATALPAALHTITGRR
ncbi:FAD-dependent monooxygenase [Streptomyces alanosinicus]|nr:FAD-dependent monooxygenase [Streptomyces alanosinicus]